MRLESRYSLLRCPVRRAVGRLVWAAAMVAVWTWSPLPCTEAAEVRVATFRDHQLFAQRSAPGEFVAVAAYTDLGPGYIGTDKAFEEGGYEPTDTAVGPGPEPVLKAAIVKLLGAKNSSHNPAKAAVVAQPEAGLGTSPR